MKYMNKHAEEYIKKLTCWKLQYEMNMLTNTLWNEHAGEYRKYMCSLVKYKRVCWRMHNELRMLANAVRNKNADEYSMKWTC